MKKLLLSIGLAMVNSTAAAQPVPAPSPLLFSLTMNHGTDARTYNMLLDTERCGEVTSADKDRVDEISVCAQQAPNGILLRTKWKLRAGTTKFETTWDAVIARGATVDVGRVGGVRLTLAMK